MSNEENASLITAEEAPKPSAKEVPKATFLSFVRLGTVWFAAVICGGITPGMVLFSHLFAEAGLFADVCEDVTQHSMTCKKQYLLITNILGIMMALVMVAMWPGGMLFDSLGARSTGVIGALMLAAGILLLTCALTIASVPLFVMAVLLVDLGSIINNFAFYGLLWHLPSWQAVLLAASNGCMQVSAVLPYVLQLFMDGLGVSLISALFAYTAAVCCGAALCWLVVPSQQEFYTQAQALLGFPIPRGVKVTTKRVKAALRSGIQVLFRNKSENIVVILLIISGQVGTYVYASQAVPFGRELFQDKQAGTMLAELYIQVTAGMGLIGVPLVGALVDYVGLSVLAFINSVCLLAVVLLVTSASWKAQKVCVFCSSFYVNAMMLFMTKYVVAIAPPQRLGNTQGAFVVLMIVVYIPPVIAFSIWIASFGEDTGTDRYFIPMRSFGIPAVIGWSAYTLRLALRPLPEMVLLKEDEQEMMRRFMLQSLADAQQVFALDRKELLARLASDDALVQRKLWEMSPTNDINVRGRYLSLARERAGKLPPKIARAAVSVSDDDGWHVCEREFTACHDALMRSFGGDQIHPGEPVLNWMFEADEASPLRSKIISSMVGSGIASGQRFGRVLSIQSSANSDVLGVCVCYPPGGLEDFEPCPWGSDRWFFVVSEHEEVLDGLQFAKASPQLVDRLVATGSQEITDHHRDQPPHWYIHMLGVVPGQRGCGLARRLLSVVFKWAEEAGVPCYLWCGLRNVPIYKKLGFENIWTEDLVVDGSRSSMHGMLRPV